MIRGHYLKEVDRFNGYTIQDLVIEYNVQKMIDHYNSAKYIKFLQGPAKLVEKRSKEAQKYFTKLVQNKANMSFTFKDEINKLDFYKVVIKDLQLEYNSNNRLVACIVNNEYRIRYDTLYCPIVNRIL